MKHQIFHFDFNHLDASENHEMEISIRGKKFPLNSHNELTLNEAISNNKAVNVLLGHKPNALTHYVHIPHEHIEKRSLTRVQVVGKIDGVLPKKHLAPLYHVSYITHIDVHTKYMAKLKKKHDTLVGSTLAAHGLTSIPKTDSSAILADQYAIMGPQDTAIHIAGQNPALMSNKPETHIAMENEHIYPVHKTDPESINQVNNINMLAQSIQEQGPATETSGYARIKQAVNPTTNLPTVYEYDLGDNKTGDPVMIYDFTDETAQWIPAATATPTQTSRNDSQFQNQTWSVNQGQTSYDIANQETSIPNFKGERAATSGASGSQWSVSPNSSTHGMTVYQDTIQLDANNNFSVEVFNNFLRIVGAYVEFYSDTEMTKPISNPPGWVEQSIPSAFETDEKKYIAIIPNVNTIMGIPMPTDNTKLNFVWPEEAQAAKLMFGGIGTYNYDSHIVWPGFIETGIFQFGIPIFFMAAGAAVTSTTWYKEFIKETDNIAMAGALIFSGGSVAFGSYAAVEGLKKALFTFGDIIASMLVTKGFEKLTEYILAKIAASEIAEAVPFVGWALRVASMALDAAELAVSLGDVLSSPAVIEIDVKRQMSFDFTLHPDPKHGEPNKPETAIWPAVGDNYKVQVNYKDGTGFEAKGQVPLTAQGGSSNEPITNNFTVPWGGKMQVIAAVYSKTGWLCGKYVSDWMDAVPDSISTGVKTTNGNITEMLVPLTQDTQYNFMQKIAYDSSLNHYWWGATKGATIPTDTVSNLNPSNVGNNIGELTGITINSSAFIIGYGWQGSGENIPLENDPGIDTGQMFVFQNLSVLSEPESCLKFPEFGFKTKPGIAYDVYGGNEKELGELNFVLDTRDATTGYLRHVNVMDGKSTYDLNSGLSYGTFTLGDIDAMAIHPSGYVIAVNWAAHRMQILKLADVAVPDASAPLAVVVSNKGILEGLLLGPKALAISPDGKIMVLESISQRVQAFDLAGNPAPSFPADELFTITGGGSMSSELNQKVAPAELISAFITNGAAHLFDMDKSFVAELDTAVLGTDILQEFADHMIYLSYDSNDDGSIVEASGDSSYITVVAKGSQWNIIDPTRNYTYVLTLQNGVITVEDQFNSNEIIVLSKDSTWQLKDLAGGKSYYLALSGSDLIVSNYLSYFPVNPKNEQLNYCDLAIESKGYLYVLSYIGDPSVGTIPNTAYRLDVYTPQGEFLFRSPDENLSGSANMEYVAAGKIALDIWRNLFSLNYEKLSGPNGRTEPSISQWIPSPPLFDLDISDATIFDSAEMSQIAPIFASHTIILSATTVCTVIKKGEHWSIHDKGNSKVYDIITALDKIDVYNLPA
jgi:hypothetical protein